MPRTAVTCPYCPNSMFKDSRGLGAHLRYRHPEAVAHKPVHPSGKCVSREEAADADLDAFFKDSVLKPASVPDPLSPKPDASRLPSKAWLDRNYPKEELPEGSLMCPLCDTNEFVPKPLQADMCNYCKKFFT